MFLAWSSLPLSTRKCGDSGKRKAIQPYTAAGTAQAMNIQRQASMPSQNVLPALPAELARTASDNSAAKIPVVMASC